MALRQVINLAGTPLLAIPFLPPVIDDMQAWLRLRREETHWDGTLREESCPARSPDCVTLYVA